MNRLLFHGQSGPKGATPHASRGGDRVSTEGQASVRCQAGGVEEDFIFLDKWFLGLLSTTDHARAARW